MKEHYRRLVALVLFVLALNMVALAQDFQPELRAQIPFSFYAGGKVLPAGSYTLTINRQNSVVTIFQGRNGVGTLLLGSPDDSTNHGPAILTFRTNGDSVYVLQKVEGPDFGFSFNAGKALSRMVENRPANVTQVVLAELGK